MISTRIASAQRFALTRLGKFGRFPETAPTEPRWGRHYYALIRLGRFPKLPLQDCAAPLCATRSPDWEKHSLQNCPNCFFRCLAHDLGTPYDQVSDTPILKDGEHTPSVVRSPLGWDPVRAGFCRARAPPLIP